MGSDLVSVIIPTRNRPEQVARAVRSVLNQSYENLEVVVVDDGSVPPVILGADIAADQRVRLLHLPTSQGPGAARNLGAAEAQGSYLAWLDDDDWWLPEKLERQLEVFSHCSHTVGAVESGYELVEDGEVILTYVPTTERRTEIDFLKEAIMAPSSVVMRKSAFDSVGRFDPTLSRSQDWDLWLRLIDGYDIRTLPEIHVRRTNHRAPLDTLLLSRQRIWARIRTQISRLPDEQRRDVESHHLLMEGILRAEMGSRADARRTLWRAWRLKPSNIRALVHVSRTFTGEAVWRSARNTMKPLWRVLVRLRGRDPLVRRW